jgi:hypothetical protein
MLGLEIDLDNFHPLSLAPFELVKRSIGNRLSVENLLILGRVDRGRQRVTT